MRDAHHACRAVDVEAGIEAIGRRRLTGVEAHAHAHRLGRPGIGREPRLSLGRSLRPLRGGLEGEVEAVALHFDLDAAVLGSGAPQELTVNPQRLHVRLRPKLLEQARRALDVGEEQSDGAAGKLAHPGRMIAHGKPEGKGLVRPPCRITKRGTGTRSRLDGALPRRGMRVLELEDVP